MAYDIRGLGQPAGTLKGYSRSTASHPQPLNTVIVDVVLYSRGGFTTTRPVLNYETGIVNGTTGEEVRFDLLDTGCWKRCTEQWLYFRGSLERSNSRNTGFTPGRRGWPRLTWAPGLGGTRRVVRIDVLTMARVCDSGGSVCLTAQTGASTQTAA
jgi:hypothetical protein